MSVTKADPPGRSVTLDSFKAAVTPAGKNGVVESVTVPLNPLRLWRVKVDWADSPPDTKIELWSAWNEKSGATTLTMT